MAYAEIEYDKLKSLELSRKETKESFKRIKKEVKQKMKKNLFGLCENQEIKQVFEKIRAFLKIQNDEITRLMEEKLKVRKKL